MQLQLDSDRLEITPDAVVLFLSSYEAARQTIRNRTAMLARWAMEFDKPHTLVRYPGCRKPFRVLASMANPGGMMFNSVLLPGIRVAQMRLSLPIVRELENFLEHPDEKWVLVKLSSDLQSQQQIAMSESCQVLISGATVEQAINRQRREYWHLPDLEDLNRSTQQLEPNNPRSIIETSWLGVDVPTRSNWRKFTYQYRLIQDDSGVLYQVGKNLDVEAVQPPALS
ncbi:MAG TPA: hypothetical protein V6D10_07270 [Trichocoleus sp.]|jgi:hypothetical protein